MRLLFLFIVFLSFSKVFSQEEDSIFIFIDRRPLEINRKDKYTEERLTSGFDFGPIGKSTVDGQYYYSNFSCPYRKGNGEILNPIIIKDRSYLKSVSKKWKDKEWVNNISVNEFVEYFDSLKGKNIFVISKYYLDKFPDKVLMFKVIGSGVKLPKY